MTRGQQFPMEKVVLPICLACDSDACRSWRTEKPNAFQRTETADLSDQPASLGGSQLLVALRRLNFISQQNAIR